MPQIIPILTLLIPNWYIITENLPFTTISSLLHNIKHPGTVLWKNILNSQLVTTCNQQKGAPPYHIHWFILLFSSIKANNLLNISSLSAFSCPAFKSLLWCLIQFSIRCSSIRCFERLRERQRVGERSSGMGELARELDSFCSSWRTPSPPRI